MCVIRSLNIRWMGVWIVCIFLLLNLPLINLSCLLVLEFETWKSACFRCLSQAVLYIFWGYLDPVQRQFKICRDALNNRGLAPLHSEPVKSARSLWRYLLSTLLKAEGDHLHIIPRRNVWRTGWKIPSISCKWSCTQPWICRGFYIG